MSIDGVDLPAFQCDVCTEVQRVGSLLVRVAVTWYVKLDGRRENPASSLPSLRPLP